MEPLSGHEIRRRWIAFFEGKKHLHLPGVSLLPQGDKSLLFVNAGVTGLKKYFDGSEIPPCRRIVNVQKSIRTNDIENVGHTARHHTFFEMLGNFSIGDYFRKEVIPWAYEILTDKEIGFGMDPEKLYCTYNPADKESFELWKAAGIKEDHLVALEGNYWEIGAGPAGPNTEVFYDRGEAYDPEHLGRKLLEDEIENDRYIEIWGIVFSQFNAEPGKKRSEYKELPSKNIDTGAGLERIACILQGTKTNFETDLFMPIIMAAEEESGKHYEGNELPFRVIADHARCLTFALADGARFSNEGRGYVLRRIIRRAMRYARALGIEKSFIYTLVSKVSEAYKDFYPELLEHVKEDEALIKAEEEKFFHTLSAGEAMLSSLLKNSGSISASDMFRLYDTYGFPVDLTEEIAREHGVKTDRAGYEKLLEEAREKSRAGHAEVDSFAKQSKDLLDFVEPSKFLYEVHEASSKVTGIFVDGDKADSLVDEGDVAFEETPFYREMGGQIGDIGTIVGEGFVAEVSAVRAAPHGQYLHHVIVKEGSLRVGDKVTLKVDDLRRKLIERNHSATHLLHAALNAHLGDAKQAGSYVCEDYLRFDYTTSRRPSAEELKAIEHEVNLKIAEGIKQETKILPIEEALKTGAEAEFGEKYGSTVRVVYFGDYSKEFCGGTHVGNTAEIGLFKIVSDEALSSGVRRITAYTSLGAYREEEKESDTLGALSSNLGVAYESLPERLVAFQEKEKAERQELETLKQRSANELAASLVSEMKKVGDINLLCKHIPGSNRDELLKLSDYIKGQKSDSLILLVGGNNGRHDILAVASGKAEKSIGAGKLLKEIAPLLGGRGGGKDNMAGGSATDISRLQEVERIMEGKANG